MSAVAIQVEGLGKQYRIGAEQQRVQYATLRDSISGAIGGLLRRGGMNGHAPAPRFWALRDINLSVAEGEVLGVIGRNGSGKSTLLKILSGITEPTEGRAAIRGRVASLLEVGTGFHGELTGAENVYLNGAILGMNRQEIRRNFDRIVEFSGIGAFIDTPVKRYSSGMYLRLAFAVAAHLDPEVMIMDEVLAVGDYEFQQRCIGRMREVGRSGRTVLFVSHNMAAVESLCTRCIHIDAGHVVRDGDTYAVTREYRHGLSRVDDEKLVMLGDVDGPDRKVRLLKSAHIVDEAGDLTGCVPVSRAFEIRIGFHTEREISDLLFVVRVNHCSGSRMITLRSPVRETHCRRLQGDHEIVCRVNEFPLTPNLYRIGLAVYSGDEMLDAVDDALSLTVTDGELYGEGRGAVAGQCVARSDWSVGPRSPMVEEAMAVAG